uniref:NADH-ubiquinone oxidoreductase chain 2 n=1 Tax=Allognosta vagans TaxID=2885619 RepID=A0A8K1KVT8_9DIPT|nr:NADH dehydrogenase subunit 2 [Allognosta vagans]
MLKNSSKLLFLMTLVSGTLITISSTSWLGAWMGLEINLLSFIPLMNNSNNLMSTEAALKYFLTQAIASAIFLMAIILWMLKNNMLMYQDSMYNNLLIISTLLIKSGTAPFHFWFPKVMDGLNWMNSLILMTWQKIAPMMLISYIFMFKIMFYIIIISAIVGALGGLNQTSLRKLMAYSSINHLSWMFTAMIDSNNMWIMYFFLYSFMSMVVIFFLNNYKMWYFNQLFMTPSISSLIKFSFFINLLSLGGLPPFLGFLPKWMIIQQLTFSSEMFMIFIMILMSLITLFFYLRLCYSSFLMGHTEYNWNFFNTINPMSMNKFTFMTFMSMTGLSFISLIYFIL